jgi:hypothetical protein
MSFKTFAALKVSSCVTDPYVSTDATAASNQSDPWRTQNQQNRCALLSASTTVAVDSRKRFHGT